MLSMRNKERVADVKDVCVREPMGKCVLDPARRVSLTESAPRTTGTSAAMSACNHKKLTMAVVVATTKATLTREARRATAAAGNIVEDLLFGDCIQSAFGVNLSIIWHEYDYDARKRETARILFFGRFL